MSANFEAAQDWARKRYNVVPQKAVGRKYPGVKWMELQDRCVTPKELASWRPMFENGVGFITGAVSDIVVIESDGPEGEAVLAEFGRLHGPLPDTLTILSGSGRGLHRHFKHPGFRVKTVANPSIKLDVKGDKGYCVLPPSLHKSGRRYEIVHDFAPAPLPHGLLEFIEMKAAEASGASTRARDHAREHLVPAITSGSGGNITPSLPPPPPEAMRGMLQHLALRGCFEERGGPNGTKEDGDGRLIKIGWVNAGMALKLAYPDEVGFDLWSETHVDDQARADAPRQWLSFASTATSGRIGIGTLIKAAKDAGFVPSFSTQPILDSALTVADAKFTGTGGDVENGKLFATEFRNKLLHIHETDDWLLFDVEQGWIAAPPGEADRAAKEVLAKLRREVSERYQTAGPEDSIVKRMMVHVRSTTKAGNLRAMIEMAKSEAGMTVRLSEFDADPMLLGVLNGVLDLRAGTLLRTSPDILVSKRCNVPYDPSATCPRFVQFLKEVQPEKEMAYFLMRLILLCHKLARWQQGQRGKRLAMLRASLMRMVAIDALMWRSARIGGSAWSVTRG